MPAGLTIDPATGVISGTLGKSASAGGPYTITVTATDPTGGRVQATFRLTVTNPPPVAVNDTFAGEFGRPITGNVSSNDSDPDGDALVFAKATDPANGTLVFGTNGTFTFTGAATFAGTNTFTYTVTDADGGRATATVSLVVGNGAPTTSGITDRTGVDNSAFNLPTAPSFSDPNNDRLTFAATGLPPGLTIDPATGVISGTLGKSASGGGPYTITVTATDPAGGRATTTFRLTVTNPAPVAVNDSFNGEFGRPITGDVSRNDSDPDGDAVTFAKATDPAGGTLVFSTNGTFTFTGSATFTGTNSFTYTITDADGGRATATVSLAIGNGLPVATGISDKTGVDNTPFTLATAPNFSDPNGDRLTFAATGLPSGLSIDPATGVISGTLGKSASGGGPYTVTVTGTDPAGGRATTAFRLIVTNPAPVAVNDSFAGEFGRAITGDVSRNDSDPDADVLTFAKTTDSASGTVVLNTNGTFTFTGAATFSGTNTFTYTVTDADGARATATVSVVISNAVPVTTGITDRTGVDNGSFNLATAPSFSDPNGDPLTFSATGLPPGLTINPTTGVISGTIGRSASGGGPYTITVTAIDSRGGRVTTTFRLAVTNPPPVASDDSFNTPYLTALTGTVAANDSDPDGDALTFAKASDPSRGTVVLGANGAFTYTPNARVSGADSFTYTVSDVDGGRATARVTVTIGNAAPVAVNDRFVINEDETLRVTAASGVLANDTDVENSALAALLVTPTTNGVVALNRDGSFVYTPKRDFNGADSFTYRANDGTADSAPATVSITVTPVPDLAIAVDDAYFTDEGKLLSVVSTNGVLVNDRDGDGRLLTAVLVTRPEHGTLDFKVDGTFSYLPETNYFGIDQFTYRANNGVDASEPATVSIGVLAKPENLLPEPVDQKVVQNGLLVLSSGNNPPNAIRVRDRDSTNLTVTLTVTNGTLAVSRTTGLQFANGFGPTNVLVMSGAITNLNGALDGLTYRPKAEYFGPDTLKIRTVDEGGRFDADRDAMRIEVELASLGGVPSFSLEFLGQKEGTQLASAKVLSFDTNIIGQVSLNPTNLAVQVLPIGRQDGSTNATEVKIQVAFSDGSVQEVSVPVIIYQPLLTSVEDDYYNGTFNQPVFNPQTSLFEQKVEIKNNTPFEFRALRVYATNLQAGVTLMNTSGTNDLGFPYVEHNLTIPSRSSQSLTLEYFSRGRKPFTPGLRLELLDKQKTVEAPPATESNTITVSGFLGYTPNKKPKFYLEFPSKENVIYYIQYRDDVSAEWKTSPTPVRGTGKVVQWLDEGPPNTDSPPTKNRFYRVLAQ